MGPGCIGCDNHGDLGEMGELGDRGVDWERDELGRGVSWEM